MNHIVYFQEEKHYLESTIRSKLSFFSEDKFKGFMDGLRRRKISRVNNDYTFSFQYVGIIEYEHTMVIFAPKFFGNIQDQKKLGILMKLLIAYSSKEKLNEDEIETFGDFEDESYFNRFSVIDFLLNDYSENGLYVNEKLSYMLNGNEEIDWHKTVEEVDSYIIKNRPIYVDYYTKVPFNDEDEIIHLIHKAVLEQCSRFMESYEFLGIFQYEHIFFDIELDEIGDREFLISTIEKEMQQQFSDRKFRVLQALHFFIAQEKSFDIAEQLSIFGTRSFHTVWEKVCGTVLGNQYETYKEEIPKPIWIDLQTYRENKRDTLIPDILVMRKEIHSFFIIDAKYYLTSFKKGELINNSPGIGDITKQYLYEKALIHLPEVQESSRYNMFLLPTEKDNEIFGKIQLPLFKEYNDIYLLRLNATDLFEAYITNKVYSLDFFQWISASIR